MAHESPAVSAWFNPFHPPGSVTNKFNVLEIIGVDRFGITARLGIGVVIVAVVIAIKAEEEK